MRMSPGLRTMTGFLTLGLYGLVGVAAWPATPWLTYACVVLAVIRFVLLIRQWPRK